MTDTPRTRAELLSIFADGQAANSITPQDMRDLVVSIGAFPQAVISKRQNNAGLNGLYDPYTKGVITQIGGGNDCIVDWLGGNSVALYDPNGWLNAAPIADTEYWGNGIDPWPVGTVCVLPPGLYTWELFVQTASGISGGFVQPYMDWINNPETFYPESDMVTAHPSLGDGAASIPADQTGQTVFFGTGGWVGDVETHMVASLFATCPLVGIKWVTLTVARA